MNLLDWTMLLVGAVGVLGTGFVFGFFLAEGMMNVESIAMESWQEGYTAGFRKANENHEEGKV